MRAFVSRVLPREMSHARPSRLAARRLLNGATMRKTSRALLLSIASLAALTLAACSSGGSVTPGTVGAPGPVKSVGNDPAPSIQSDTTWNDGLVISVPTVIEAGATVTIANGATIKMVDGVTITVKGTLKSGASAKAKLTGGSWVGIVVATGGTLALDGVDIENATAAIDVAAKPAGASYDNATISNSLAPFVVEGDGALTTTHATVTASRGTSHIVGSLKASFLDYDANGFDGLTAENDAAELSVEDSTLHGGGGMSDMIVSYTGAANIHVAYTNITKVHCAFHLERVTGLDVSYVTATADSYGFMMYGSLPNGTRTIKSSNFTSNYAWGIDEQDSSINGPIAVDGCYFSGNGLGDVHLHTASKIQVTNDATAPIASAKPR
jgi:hypothetical protein